MKLAILRNEDPGDHLSWVKACERIQPLVIFRIIDITKNDWFEDVKSFNPTYLLAKPSGNTNLFRQLYLERLDILVNDCGFKSFPSFDEIRIYENKRFFSYWLKANNIPHAKTFVFYHSNEAEDFIKGRSFPLVAKSNIGASGSGVVLIKNESEGTSYIRRSFFGNGAPKRLGPNLSRGGLIKRGLYYISHPGEIRGKLDHYRLIASDIQSNFVIFQEYIDHTFEWRVVRIGESFFAHKKLKTGEKASGSLLKLYDNPPFTLLDFVRKITDTYGFFSQAVDVFEKDGKYLVNEMQCIFGQSDPFQMKVNERIGRYRYLVGKWEFEEGDFAKNACFDLRIEYVLSTLENR